MAVKNVTVPDLGSSAEVTVIEVLIKPGDKIETDTPIVTLESDKATMDVPSSDGGVVKEVKVKVGDHVKSGSALITLEEAAGDEKATETAAKPTAKSAEAKPAEAKEVKPTEAKEAKPAEAKSSAPSPQAALSQKIAAPEAKPMPSQAKGAAAIAKEEAPIATSADVHAGPGVRRLAREFGVNLGLVPGSGPKARILREDVQSFVKSQLTQSAGGTITALPPVPVVDFAQFGPIETQALSRIKKISGKNLQRNWMTIPQVTQFGEADITSLEEFRQSRKDELEKQKIKFTPLVFVMKAVVTALKAFPHFNASLDASSENLIIKKYFHIGVAVDTPDGLVVPVIRNVDQKGLIELAKELATVSEKARTKQLMPADMQGGCFSISSLGGIGGTAFTPIVNFPEVAILGVSKTSYKPVYQDGAFVPRLTLPLSLTYDHRVVDGADGARFIMYLTHLLSDIRNLLL